METETVVATKNYLDQKRELLIQRQNRQLKAFQEAVKADCEGKNLGRLYERICRTKEFLDALNQIKGEEKSSASTPGRVRYVISSLFLHECFKALTADAEEEFFFVTGSLINGVYVLDQKTGVPASNAHGRGRRWPAVIHA